MRIDELTNISLPTDADLDWFMENFVNLSSKSMQDFYDRYDWNGIDPVKKEIVYYTIKRKFKIETGTESTSKDVIRLDGTYEEVCNKLGVTPMSKNEQDEFMEEYKIKYGHIPR